MAELAHIDEHALKREPKPSPFADRQPPIAADNLTLDRDGWTTEGVLALQRTAGNQAVARMVARRPRGASTPTSRSLRAKTLGDGQDRPEAPAGAAPVTAIIEPVPEEAGADATTEGTAATAEPADVAARQKSRAHTAVDVCVSHVQPGPVRAGAGLELRSKAATSVASGAPPSNALGAADYGLTMEESIVPTMGAKKVGTAWHPVITKLVGNFSQQVRLLAGQTEVTGPGGNTAKTNFCKQAKGLKTLGNTVGNPWYMLQAVKDHEDVHAAHFGPGLVAAEPAITAALEAVSIPDAAGMTQVAAASALAASATFKAAVTAALQTWIAQDNILLAGDHATGGPCEVAEHKVVDPMVTSICAHAKKESWGACADCPP
jgi:hypothetical protein